MENLILIAALLLIIGAAAWYVWKSRKAGVKCIGCPDGAACGGTCSGCKGCGSPEK